MEQNTSSQITQASKPSYRYGMDDTGNTFVASREVFTSHVLLAVMRAHNESWVLEFEVYRPQCVEL